jgi:hypothetical protein
MQGKIPQTQFSISHPKCNEKFPEPNFLLAIHNVRKIPQTQFPISHPKCNENFPKPNFLLAIRKIPRTQFRC